MTERLDIEDEASPGEVARAQLARVEAESAQRRIAFLYQATGALFASPLDESRRLTVLADLVVPDLADWCFVDLFDGGSFERVAAAHWDPDRQERARLLVGRRGDVGDEGVGLGRVRRSGQAELVQLGATASREAWVDADHLRLLGEVDVKSLVVAPLRGTAGIIGALTLVFAESARQHIADDLALARDLAQRASLALDNARLYESTRAGQKLQEELLAIVSHDLRNPLNTILLGAKGIVALRRGDTPDQVRSFAERILRAGDQMKGLIDDLLTFGTIERGGLHVAPQPCSASLLLSRAHDLVQLVAARAGIALVPELPDGEVDVLADENRVLQVLSNLLGNAVKFSPPRGHIRVGAQVGASGTDVVFWVADEGAGIPPGLKDRVFERYFKVEGTGRGGTGLGLYIARSIVEAHGGRIWVESEPGRGSTFHFTLPRVPFAPGSVLGRGAGD